MFKTEDEYCESYFEQKRVIKNLKRVQRYHKEELEKVNTDLALAEKVLEEMKQQNTFGVIKIWMKWVILQEILLKS